MTLHGGMNAEERERIKAAFQADPEISPVRILLATDAASEGIDLQNHCSRLIHYEIPWNPNRMEQRNGRVDRHGQRADEVLVYHFVGKGYDSRRIERVRAPGRPRRRPRVPHAGRPQGGRDKGGPRQGRPRDRRPGRAGDARPPQQPRHRDGREGRRAGEEDAHLRAQPRASR